MGLFDNVKDSIKGSGSQNDGDGFDSGKFDKSFSSDDSGSAPENDPFDSPQDNSDIGGNPVNGQQNRSNSRRNSLEPKDPLESGNKPVQGSGENQPQNGFKPQNDVGSDRANTNNSPNPRAGRPEEGGSQPQLSNDTKKKMEDAGFNLDQDQGGRDQGRGSRQGRGQQGFEGQQSSVASNRDGLDEIKSQNQQIIELLKRISDALNSGQETQSGVSGRNRHGGRR